MDEHHRIEREADEAFAAFRRKWPVDAAGEPTGVELWHHAWRSSLAAERERCAKKPLTAQQLDKLIEAHVGGGEIDDNEYYAMVLFAAAVERAHGIGA